MDEKKILDLLTQLVEDVAGVKADLTNVKTDLTDVKTKVDKLSIEHENIIIPRLDLLYEGQTALAAQMKERAMREPVKELESTVHMLTDAAQMTNREIDTIKSDIAALKKAL